MARKQRQEYPKMVYGPNDQQRIIQKDDVMPEGFAEHPSMVGVAKSSSKPEDAERAATIASLREAGVEISDNASDEEINAAIDELTKHEED